MGKIREEMKRRLGNFGKNYALTTNSLRVVKVMYTVNRKKETEIYDNEKYLGEIIERGKRDSDLF